ncbi:hypothetical protein G6F23_013745 [Rhizopus arrhizus]|nr:hypothetical protein G6F23_013745 [Rhizopus arrhizus]
MVQLVGVAFDSADLGLVMAVVDAVGAGLAKIVAQADARARGAIAAIRHHRFAAGVVAVGTLGLEIDDATDGAVALQHGRRALQHFDAFDRADRQRVEVDEGVLRVEREAEVGHAVAVDQHQRVLRRQATQADRGRAGGETAARR